MGYDIHRLVTGRKLILGGVTIPYKKGLLGHSDADVLVHALCDALLGAIGLGDIGTHFPDTSSEFKDISSMIILSRTWDMVWDRGFSLENADATILAEQPKLAQYRTAMRQNIAGVMNVAPHCINIKATTTEKLGMFGRGEGVGAMCVVLLS
ncbi:2-C-methyl-D-erythritol 2,4-cyclodiphosphate synthase [Desulfococcaceae bacterium HSG9]|nr:2-C-methyl-D-erythritol 2,4-cyclodiphosphate synthase [Desulfococcaceae bacterium HSG9]